MKKTFLFMMLLMTMILSLACSSENTSSPSSGETSNGRVVIDVDGEKTTFKQCTFKTERQDGIFLATQIHATNLENVFALGWYKLETVDQVVPGDYAIDAKLVYALYNVMKPDLRVFIGKEGLIKVMTNDGKSIKGTFACKFENKDTREIVTIAGSFDIPY